MHEGEVYLRFRSVNEIAYFISNIIQVQRSHPPFPGKGGIIMLEPVQKGKNHRVFRSGGCNRGGLG